MLPAGSSVTPECRSGCRMDAAIRRAAAVASSGECSPGIRTANSSPPSRATVSSSRSCSPIRRATSSRTASPAWWPRVSLMSLKRSRSMTSTAVVGALAARERQRLAGALGEEVAVGKAGQCVTRGQLAVGDRLAAGALHGEQRQRDECHQGGRVAHADQGERRHAEQDALRPDLRLELAEDLVGEAAPGVRGHDARHQAGVDGEEREAGQHDREQVEGAERVHDDVAADEFEDHRRREQREDVLRGVEAGAHGRRAAGDRDGQAAADLRGNRPHRPPAQQQRGGEGAREGDLAGVATEADREGLADQDTEGQRERGREPGRGRLVADEQQDGEGDAARDDHRGDVVSDVGGRAGHGLRERRARAVAGRTVEPSTRLAVYHLRA